VEGEFNQVIFKFHQIPARAKLWDIHHFRSKENKSWQQDAERSEKLAQRVWLESPGSSHGWLSKLPPRSLRISSIDILYKVVDGRSAPHRCVSINHHRLERAILTMQVAVIDQNRRVLPHRLREYGLLLKEGKAAVFRMVEEVQVPDLWLKLDPGSRKTGLAIVNQGSGQIIFAAEIESRH
jgi:hypothetical protein